MMTYKIEKTEQIDASEADVTVELTCRPALLGAAGSGSVTILAGGDTDGFVIPAGTVLPTVLTGGQIKISTGKAQLIYLREA